MMRCDYCGQIVNEKDDICPNCKQSLKDDFKPFEGLDIKSHDEKREVNKQKDLVTIKKEYDSKNKKIVTYDKHEVIVAFFLCLFLGVLGIHRFYERKIYTGILYFLTGALFGVGWFYDIVRLLIKLFK